VINFVTDFELLSVLWTFPDSVLFQKLLLHTTDPMGKFLEWLPKAFPTQYIRCLLLPRVCRRMRDWQHLLVRPCAVPTPRQTSLVSDGLFDHIFGNDLASEANSTYHRVESTEIIIERTSRAAYFPQQPLQYRIPVLQLEQHLNSMDGKCDNYCKDHLKRSNTLTAYALVQLNAHILCGIAMSPAPQSNPGWWSGYNWSVFFSTAFNRNGRPWTVQTETDVLPFNHNMPFPRSSVVKNKKSITIYDRSKQTAKHKVAIDMGYSLNRTKSSLQVCCHPMTLKIVSIEVIARVGHDPSKGPFSGAVGSVVGVHSNHSARMTMDAEEAGIKLAHARFQAMSHQCELQVFIDFDLLIDIDAANQLWSAALCKTRNDFVASKALIHMNWQNHVRECKRRKLCPCKRCFTSVPPHPAHRTTVCSVGWALCKCRIMWT
jgi:hypothetical protein